MNAILGTINSKMFGIVKGYLPLCNLEIIMQFWKNMHG